VNGHLSVVSSNTTELWDGFLSSINADISIDFSINFFFDSILDSLDNGWDDGALNKWNKDGSDLGDKSTGKFNINIIWVNLNVGLLDTNLWCSFP